MLIALLAGLAAYWLGVSGPTAGLIWLGTAGILFPFAYVRWKRSVKAEERRRLREAGVFNDDEESQP